MAEDKAEAIKEGYLGKKMKSKMRGIKQRYFKLFEYELVYWYSKEDSDSGKDAVATIPLKVSAMCAPFSHAAGLPAAGPS